MAAVVERQTLEQDQVGDQIETVRTTAVEDPTARRSLNKGIQVVWFLAGIVEVLLAIRFVLQLLGASPASSFVDFLYRITEPLVAPFYGVFQTTLHYGTARLDLETVLAMFIYAIIAWGIASLIRLAK
jgi:uncharacterized protein YggT (Ycf19 family)